MRDKPPTYRFRDSPFESILRSGSENPRMIVQLPYSALGHLEWLNVPMWVFDFTRKRHVWANPAGLAFWKSDSVAEFAARDFGDMSPSAAARLHAVLQAHREGRSTREQWTLYPRGKPMTTVVQSCGIELEDGGEGLLFAADTVRAEAEPQVLRGVEAMQHTPVCVAMYRLDDGMVLMRNPAAVEVFGSGSKPSQSDAFLVLFADPSVGEKLLKEAAQGRSVACDAQLVTRDGLRWHALDARPMRDPVSGALALQVNTRDISDLRGTQQALEEARRAADFANAAKSRFLANMSHEIRTPMNGVLGITGLLLDTKLDAKQRELLLLAHESAQSLLTIVNDILDFSKIEADRIHLEHVSFDLHKLVMDVVRLLQSGSQHKGLRVVFDIAPGTPRQVLGDAGRLRQVLNNLVGNAIKFTEAGEVSVHLHADTLPHDHAELQFTVSDTGVGMSAQEQSKVFEAFMQADNSVTRRYGGTGLGLSISRRLVELMGGRISMESSPGKGSVFRFSVRCGLHASSKSAGYALASERELLNGRCVLLVEDNAINQTITKAMLDALNVSCDVAGNGLEALQMLHQRDYAAVLMDIHMPVMDGHAATIEIRRREKSRSDLPRVPIIAVTALSFDADRERCMEVGMDGFVTKPVQMNVLATALVDALCLRQQPG